MAGRDVSIHEIYRNSFSDFILVYYCIAHTSYKQKQIVPLAEKKKKKEPTPNIVAKCCVLDAFCCHIRCV